MITVSGTTEAILNIVVTKADTDALGVARHPWQAAAGPIDPPVVARGLLRLEKRLVVA